MLALVGWIAGWAVGKAGDAGARGTRRMLFGDEQTQALNQIVPLALDRTVDLLGEHLEPDDRQHLRSVLAERDIELGAGLARLPSLRDALVAWVEPLEDVGGYLSAMGIDPTELADVLTEQLWQGINANAVTGGPLKPMADYLAQQQLLGLVLANATKLDNLSREGIDLPGRHLAPKPARYLPGKDRAFTGREDVVQHLRAKIAEHDPAGAVVVIHAIDGMAGVGKTALAIHVAHELAGRYRDGAFMVDLLGYTPGMAPLSPVAALTRLLRQDQLPAGDAGDLPADLDVLQAEWRSRMASRQAIVVLDNALDSAQVRPLLPGGAGCLVLITSRRRLVGLTDAIPLTVDVLPQDEAAELLRRLIGTTRPDDPAAVATVVEMCGRLPLAIRIVAAQLLHHPGESVAEVAASLSDARTRLESLQAEDVSVAASIGLSYQALPPELQRAFVLCGLHPGPDITAEALGALGDVTVPEAARWLRELADYHLADVPDQAASGQHYEQHDLVRAFARRLASELPVQLADAAICRLVRHYREWLGPNLLSIDGMRPAEIAASIWWSPASYTHVIADQANMIACVMACRERPGAFRELADLLSRLGPYLLDGRDPDAQLVYRQLLEIADTTSDQQARLAGLLGLAAVRLLDGDFPAARDRFADVCRLAAATEDLSTEIDAWRCLADTERMIGDPEAAATCYQEMRRLAVGPGGHDEAIAVQGLAELAAESGDLGLARALLQRAAELADEGGDLDSLADAVWWLAELALLADDAAARAHFSQWQQLRDRYPTQIAAGLLGLARAEAAAGQLTAARALAEEAYAVAAVSAIDTDTDATGHVAEVVQVLVRLHAEHDGAVAGRPRSLGAVAVQIAALEGRRNPVAAEAALRRLAGEADAAGDLAVAADAYRAIGDLLEDSMDLDAIHDTFRQAYDRASQLGDRRGQLGDLLRMDRADTGDDLFGWAAGLAGQIAAEIGEPRAELYALRRLAFRRAEVQDDSDAIRTFLAAYELAGRVGTPDEQADIMLRLGDVERAAGDLDAAHQHYRQASVDGMRAVNGKLRARALGRLSPETHQS